MGKIDGTSNPHVGFGAKKAFGISVGSSTSLDPCVSCKRYGESTKPSKTDRDLAQRRFSNPPFDDLDFILVGLGEKGKNCGVKRK